MVNGIISNQVEKESESSSYLQQFSNYEKWGSWVKMTETEGGLISFTAKYTTGNPVKELYHDVWYQLLDSDERQMLYGFETPPGSSPHSEIYLKSCLVGKSKSHLYIRFRTPGGEKKKGKIERNDIVEVVGYKDGHKGLLTKIAGKESLGYQFVPWSDGNHVLKFKLERS